MEMKPIGGIFIENGSGGIYYHVSSIDEFALTVKTTQRFWDRLDLRWWKSRFRSGKPAIYYKESTFYWD
jgi:hypothetical protein